MDGRNPKGLVLVLLLVALILLIVWVLGVLASLEHSGPNLTIRLSPGGVLVPAVAVVLGIFGVFFFARART